MHTPKCRERSEKRHLNKVLGFCGARLGGRPVYKQAAWQMGKLLADEGYCEFLYGGGSSGLMHEFSDGAHAGGARVTGIVPKAFLESNGAQNPAFDTVDVITLSDRKNRMFDHADICIAIPGGWGTFDEIFTIAGCNDENRHIEPEKPVVPIIIINTDGYFDGIILQLRRSLEDKMTDAGQARMIHIVDTPEEAIACLNALNEGPQLLARDLNDKTAPLAPIWQKKPEPVYTLATIPGPTFP